MSLDFNARIDYKYQGGDTKFSVPFSYINKSHIYVIINGDIDNPTQEFAWLSENQISLAFTPNIDDIVSIRRVTPNNEKMVVFEDNNILDEETQNLAQDQIFNVVQEIEDSNNDLLSQMDEFISQKDYVDEMLSDINNIQSVLESATQLNAETQELVEGISETYEKLKDTVEKGSISTIPHNLFELVIYDKSLSTEEQIGLGKQGSKIRYEEYSDAYTVLNEEYNTGIEKVYTDDEVVTYTKSYEGSESGLFYTPSDTDLIVGEAVYSDSNCTTLLGNIESVENTEADKYTGSITSNFYTQKDSELIEGREVYSDNILTNVLGTIEELSSISSYKYKASTSGIFYISSDLNIRVGRIIYSDAALSQELGTITGVNTFKSDRYSISGLDSTTEFFVPENTIITEGTKLYTDSSCSVELGTVTKKGQISVDKSYYYNIVPVFGWSSFHYQASFYTKQAIPDKAQDNINLTCYFDKGCLNPMKQKVISKTDGTFNGKPTITLTPQSGSNFIATYQLITYSTGTSSSYINIDNNDTQLSYYKQGTVSTEIINIDNGINESYSLEGIESGDYIKISGIDLQKYNKTGSISTGTIVLNINEQSVKQSYTSKGVITSSGIVFTYKEASNGHKIVPSLYEEVINNLITSKGSSEFYIINNEEESFILPTLDLSKNIYFCLGNTVLTPSSIQGVTKEYLNNELENYAKLDNETLLAIQTILDSYNNTLGDIQSSLENILGE